MYKKDEHVITKSRLCKRDIGLKQKKQMERLKRIRRRKRFVLSNNKWTVDENILRFNFQNYRLINLEHRFKNLELFDLIY